MLLRKQKHAKSVYQPGFTLWHLCLVFVLICANLLPLIPTLATSVQAAPLASTNALTINVISARSEPRAFGGDGVAQGDPIPDFKYIINVDNTGTTTQRPNSTTGVPPTACTPADPGYPASCAWVSVAGSASSSPIYAQGDQSDFTASGSAALPALANMPAGRYLISVIADGYKLDGAHFSVPMNGPVTVELQPFPLPDATIRAFVFEDISPTNSAPDVPAEHGLAGFVGHIADYIGEVTTDVYGNPLCTVYEGEDPVTHVIPPNALDADMLPIPIPGTGGQCVSDTNGDLVIPHLGPNRYALSAVKPDGTNWIQTTTLEGNHDWDAWVMEGATGYDTEFVVAGEQFPAIIFGFVNKATPNLGGNGTIKGVVDAFKTYVPAKGGLTSSEPMVGSKIDKPIEKPWISLNDLQNGDTAIWIGQGDVNGAFTIPNVPPGNYTLTWWDEPQDYILNLQNVTVGAGETVDLGVLPLNGWWTQLEGYVFNDLNRNGVKDAGEPGIPNFPVVMRKRENSVMDRGAVLVTTDANGYYFMENLYPMTQWLVVEAYSDLYYTTGVTYQADNQDTPTTLLGAGVDVSILPIIGLGGRLDWGIHNYAFTGGTPGIDPNNGGIVGTVSYDTTRNEIDPRFAAVEDWQPGVPDLNVNLYLPVDCPVDGSAPCDASGRYQLASDGSMLKGKKINSYVTETWQRPGLNDDGYCVARDVNGDPLLYPNDQQITNSSSDCLEAPLMGVQFQTGFSTVNGNYGFADGCFGTNGASGPETCADASEPTALTVGDYLVEVEIPNDATGRPLYQVTKEEDINIANGDQFVPQIPPPECAGALHTVDVAGIRTDHWPAVVGDGGVTNDLPTGVVVPASTPIVNTTFAADLNGSYYEGQQKPLCSTKLVHVSNGRSIAPTFNLFTDVPLPGRFWGLIVDDLNFSSSPKSLAYGEKAGVPFAPVGIYDWTNRLVATVESDYNGLWDVLLPSTNRINCPTPSGVCANLYRTVGNDPGTPGHLNLNYKPQFRTIAAEFETIPGLIVPADLAPTQVGVATQLPGGQFNQVTCAVNSSTSLTRPELFAVSQPYVNGSGSFNILGQGFGSSAGQVLLDAITLPTTSWSDTFISVNVPAGTPAGPHQLKISRSDNGNSTINGLTFHVLGSISAVGPFPSTSVLDNFNNRLLMGNNWGTNGSGLFLLVNGITPANYLRIRATNNNFSTARWTSGASFGTNQEAFFTFRQPTTATASDQQGLMLKWNGPNSSDPANNSARWIEVALDSNDSPTNRVVAVYVKTGTAVPTTPVATFTAPSAFVAGDVLGARALSDGTINIYKNSVQIGTTNVAATSSWTGNIGIRFEGTSTSLLSTDETQIDDFGGGNVGATLTTYQPNLYQVGPGRTYATIQDAIDAATASNGDDLVVVYPGTPDLSNPRANPRGAYYENLIITSPIKLQGVGPGGIQQATNTTVAGSILDGSAFGGDTALADAWRAKITTLTHTDPNTGDPVPNWVGNPTVSEGEVILLLALAQNQYGANFKAAVDGFDIRGGDQQGQANILTQGGAIFANAYIRNLQITNNVIQNNSSSYGTIRIGTPDLPAPDTSQHNENLRIANNRIIQNGGTNLAGGIALFAGADNYEVALNDICGNFSAEYGGGMTAYGLNPNGKIHDNRIYFNESYDEGGGIMIAGQLPANPSTLSPGSGPVDIYNNLIQNNMANDDGGGLRFLMAGNFPMNVYNNMIVNNISTHEGGGIGLNDAPNVRVYNNTIMKNVTTATAITSNGFPAPAGLSTSANSDLLQASLPGGSPLFSNPLLFNNIFWDNRAGTRSGATVTGLTAANPNDPAGNGANHWDLGVADGTGSLAPTNSILQIGTGTTASASNSFADPAVVSSYNVAVNFAPWRNNPALVDAIMVVNDLPPNLLGNYHLGTGSVAIDLGASSKSGVTAPAFDIDGGARPNGPAVDSGADEFGSSTSTPPPPQPSTTFPATAVLDNFNRGSGSTTPLGSNWSGNTSTNNFRINGSNVQSQSGAGEIWWNPAQFGADQEAYLKLVTIGTSNNSTARWQGLLLKFNGTAPNVSAASAIEVRYRTTTGVTVRTKASGTTTWVDQATMPVTFANTDILGARVQQDGTVSVYKNGVLIGAVNVTQGPNPWPTTLVQGGGWIGVSYNFSGDRFDDFGGGNVPTVVQAASSDVPEGVGQLSESDTIVTELEAGMDEETQVKTLFLPIMTAGSSNSEQAQTATPPATSDSNDQGAAGSDENQNRNNLYLPMVSK